jgi:hypothetical protein
MLVDTNLALSLIGAASVGILFALVRKGSTYHGVVQDPARVRGRVHAKVGSTTLLFYALLGVTTALGAWIPGPQDYIAVVAVTFRVGIAILLVSWVAWEADARYHGRWPKLDRRIDYVLTFGHHVDIHHHAK